MTWLDLVLTGLLALSTALGAQRRMTGLLVGAGAVVLFRLLLGVFSANLLIGLAFALFAGVLLGLLGRSLVQQRRGPSLPASLLGGLGGLLLGALLILSTVTSLPIEYNARGEIVYPPQTQFLSLGLQPAVTNSRLVGLGRDILLYPLLAQSNPDQAGGLLSGLHAFFVVGEPWRGGP